MHSNWHSYCLSLCSSGWLAQASYLEWEFDVTIIEWLIWALIVLLSFISLLLSHSSEITPWLAWPFSQDLPLASKDWRWLDVNGCIPILRLPLVLPDCLLSFAVLSLLFGILTKCWLGSWKVDHRDWQFSLSFLWVSLRKLWFSFWSCLLLHLEYLLHSLVCWFRYSALNSPLFFATIFLKDRGLWWRFDYSVWILTYPCLWSLIGWGKLALVLSEIVCSLLQVSLFADLSSLTNILLWFFPFS